MLKVIPRLLCVSIALLLIPATQAVGKTKKAAPTAAVDPLRDPQAFAALDKMGAALRGLKQFSLTSETSTEVVLDSGKKVELDGMVSYKAVPPSSLFVELNSERKQRQLYFNKGKLSIFAPRLNYYASADVKAKTLGDLVVNAGDKYGIDLPLADMFFWGTKQASKDGIKVAMFVGGGKIDGQRVNQYAFSQEGADWQVWIAEDTSLPKQLVITNTDDSSLPQYRARLNWDTKTPVSASTFQFTPPADAARIEIVPVKLAVADKKKGK